jgi:hypothetical protein
MVTVINSNNKKRRGTYIQKSSVITTQTKKSKMSSNGRFASFFFNAFTYSTVRSATIQSKKVGLIYRLAQLGILSYIIG